MKKLGAKTSKALDTDKIEQAEYEDENDSESETES
jgi:hypothetical protein